ncbi:GNAT family N-acetyltransferase [Neobacillus sp. LXY-4]|uniref:GNAT family N-acetyltransferase n=1 Tax=Neobacillus sp. LXY-4 TaxID=3379826 RepID=UPI003EE2310D
MTIWKENEFIISTKKDWLNVNVIYNFLTNESYWAKGRSRETIEKSIENSSFCFGIYREDENGQKDQVGFARVVSDLTTFAYLCDVFVLPNYRGRGLSKWLLSVIIQHPELMNVRRFMLATNDAHSLYAQYGFKPLKKPEMFMEITRANI